MNWIDKAQEGLRKAELAGWLLYDFRGSNPMAKKFIKLDGFLSRRVFCYIPAEGFPSLLVHAIEAGSLPAVPMNVKTYSSRQSLTQALRDLLPQAKVAMEFSPNNDIPYVSHVDAGTIDLLRSLGVDVVSSDNLLQVFSTWTKRQISAHEEAAELVMNAKNLAFEYLTLQVPLSKVVRETDVQKVITDYFDSHKLEYEHPPIIGFAAHAGDPHYVPRRGQDAVLQKGDVILIDLWAKLPEESAPYADITWMAVYGEPSEEIQTAWTTVKDARDLAVTTLKKSYKEGRYPEGREIDRVCRDFIAAKGYADAFMHRTGHSIGTAFTHGDAAHLDDFETCDTRLLQPGFGITIEPGVYFKEFGVRSEINLMLEKAGPRLTTEVQEELIVI